MLFRSRSRRSRSLPQESQFECTELCLSAYCPAVPSIRATTLRQVALLATPQRSTSTRRRYVPLFGTFNLETSLARTAFAYMIMGTQSIIFSLAR